MPVYFYKFLFGELSKDRAVNDFMTEILVDMVASNYDLNELERNFVLLYTKMSHEQRSRLIKQLEPYLTEKEVK